MHTRGRTYDETPQRILLIRPSALGDVARTVPMIVSLRRAFPRATIDWLVQDGFDEVVRDHPDLDECLPFPRNALGRSLRRGSIGELARWTRRLRDRRYDTVIDAQGLFRSAWISRCTGARTRVGHADARECGAIFYNRRIRSRSIHTVDRMLDLLGGLAVEPVGNMTLHSSPGNDTPEAARGAVVIAPTSRWAAKRWPIERFTEIARRVTSRTPHHVVVLGAPNERDQCGPLVEFARSHDRVHDLIGALSIAELARAISVARLVIANDSAAAHIAVGFDRPLVALYGPTDIDRVGPYQRADDVIQRLEPGDNFGHKDPKNLVMMQRIGVEDVWSACRERLALDMT